MGLLGHSPIGSCQAHHEPFNHNLCLGRARDQDGWAKADMQGRTTDCEPVRSSQRAGNKCEVALHIVDLRGHAEEQVTHKVVLQSVGMRGRAKEQVTREVLL